MGFIETSYGSNPNLSQVNIDSDLTMGSFDVTATDITASGVLTASGEEFNGDQDMNNNDIVNIKRLLCSDYFGAAIAAGSTNLRYTKYLDDFSDPKLIEYSTTYSNKLIRIPSNFINGSTIRLSYYVETPNLSSSYITGKSGIYKLNSNGTKSQVFTKTTAKGVSEWITTTDIIVNAGELFGIFVTTKMNAYGTSGLKIYYDLTAVLDAEWDIIEGN